MQYLRSAFNGACLYVAMMSIASLFFDKDSTFSGQQKFLLMMVIGPFYFTMFLGYPSVPVVFTLICARFKKIVVNPSFVSSTFVIFGMMLLVEWNVFNYDMSHLLFATTAVLSCVCGWIYSKYAE